MNLKKGVQDSRTDKHNQQIIHPCNIPLSYFSDIFLFHLKKTFLSMTKCNIKPKITKRNDVGKFEIRYLYSEYAFSLKFSMLATFPFPPMLKPEIIQHKVYQREKSFVLNNALGKCNLFPCHDPRQCH